MATSREVREKPAFMESQQSEERPQASLVEGKNEEILDQEVERGKQIADVEPEGKDQIQEKRATREQEDAEALDKEESQAIKAIEKQLLDANRILLDINTKIKDVFDGDQSKSVLGISEQKMHEYRLKNSELEQILQKEIDLQEHKNKSPSPDRTSRNESNLKSTKDLHRQQRLKDVQEQFDVIFKDEKI